MAWFPEPAVVSILLDANRVAPHRSHVSDGIIGDATHAASVSDHNPDTDGGVHACDITHDPANGFNSWFWANVISNRMLRGEETRVKYLVANAGDGPDLIFHTNNPRWVQNGSYKTEHRNHLHVSIKYTDEAENDTSPFFSAGLNTEGDPVTPQEVQQIAEAVNAVVGNRVIGAVQTTLRDVTVPSIVNSVVSKLATALSSAGLGSIIDTEAIAKAVNDELHKRTAS